MNDSTITLHNGKNKIDFTYRQDAAYGIIKASLSDVVNTSFNITAGNATSLRTLAEKIISITGSKSKIEDIGEINEISDKDIDAKVERTKKRPIASGEVSIKEAFMGLTVVLIFSCLILFLLPLKSFFLAIISLKNCFKSNFLELLS